MGRGLTPHMKCLHSCMLAVRYILLVALDADRYKFMCTSRASGHVFSYHCGWGVVTLPFTSRGGALLAS